MLRRLKKEVLTDLPDKQRQKVMVQTDKAKVKEIKELLSEGKGKSAMGGENNMANFVMDSLFNFDSVQGEDKDEQRQRIMQAYTLTA